MDVLFTDDSLNSTLLDTLYSGVSDAIFIVDKDCGIHYANQTALSWLERDLPALTQQTLKFEENDQKQFFAYFDVKSITLYPGIIENLDKEITGKMTAVHISDLPTEKGLYHIIRIEDLYEKEKDHYFHQAVLEIADAANQSDNLEIFYQQVHATLKKFIAADNFYIAVYDADAQFIRFPYYVDQRDYLNPEDLLLQARSRKKQRGLTEYLINQGQSLLLTEQEIQKLSGQGEISVIGSLPKYWLGVPLINTAGKVLGGMALQSYDQQTKYTKTDEELLSFISTQITITLERKQIEERLKMERELFTKGPVVVFKQLIEGEKPGKILYVSPNIRQFGYEAEDFLRGKLAYRNIMHPGDLPTNFQQIDIENAGTHTYMSGEYRILTGDGQVRWVFDFTNIYKHENEEFVECNFYILDITDRKEAESKLQNLNEQLESRVSERTTQLVETQSFLQLLIDTIPAPIYYKNAKGEYIGSNFAYETLTGFTKAELIGKQAGDIWPEKGQAYHDLDIALIKKGGTDSFEANVTSKTKQNRDIIINKAIFANSNGETAGLVGVLLDITERKRAEHLQSVLYMISEAAGSTDNLDSLYAFVHQIVEQLMSARNFYIALYDEETEIVSFPYYFDQYTPKPNPRKLTTGLTEKVIHSKKTLFLEREYIQKLLAEVNKIPRYDLPYQWLGVPLKSQNDKIIGVITVQSYDQSEYIYTQEDQDLLEFISNQIAVAIERKQTQAQLRLLNMELEAKVKERTLQLNAQLVGVQQREQELTAVVEIAQALRKIQTVEQVYPIVLKYLKTVIEADGCSLALFDEEQQEVFFVAAEGCFLPQNQARIPLDAGAAGWVMRNSRAYLNNNVQEAPGPALLPLTGGVKALLIAPMIADDQVIGMVEVGTNQIWDDEDVRLLTAIAEITAYAIQREKLNVQKEKQLARLNSLREIDRMITGNVDLFNSMTFLLNQIVNHLKADAADILLVVEGSTFLEFGRGIGFKQTTERESLVSVKQGPAEWVMQNSEPILIRDIQNDPHWKPYFDQFPWEKFVSYYALPLKTKGQVLGILELFQRSPLVISDDWESFLYDLAQQTAIAIENAQLIDKLQRANRDMLFAYDKTIAGWAKALELRDQETGGHSLMVVEYTMKLAQMMGIRRAEELTHLRRGALLHDIGKMGIPDNILLKPDKLTTEEWVEMRKHPQYAYDLLYPIEFLRPALDIPLYHHERWDGSGYPKGLKQQEIPFAARIFAVVDVFHALISDRPYSKAWPVQEALKYISEQKGILFDPEVVNQFIRLIKTSGFLG